MFKAIPVVGSVPADGTLPATISALVTSNANGLEITGQVGESGGSGQIYLCRYFPELGVWRLWAEYAPMKSTGSGATFSGRYAISFTGPTYWCLVSPSVTVLSAHGEGVVYDAR